MLSSLQKLQEALGRIQDLRVWREFLERLLNAIRQDAHHPCSQVGRGLTRIYQLWEQNQAAAEEEFEHLWLQFEQDDLEEKFASLFSADL